MVLSIFGNSSPAVVRNRRWSFGAALRGGALVAMLLLGRATVARAQADAGDESDPGGAMGDDSVAAVDFGGGGGAPRGETPPKNAPFQPPPQPQPTTISAPQDFYDNWVQWKTNLAKKTGTTFDLYMNASDQGVIGRSNGDINRGVVWYNFHLGQTLWTGAQLLMNVRGGDGDGVNRYADTLFNFNQHEGEDNGGYISHLFLQQKLFKDKVTLSIGKLDLLDFFDDNEVTGWNLMPYSLARDPSIPVPYHALGAVARWDLIPFLYVQAGIADAGGNPHSDGFNSAFRNDESSFTMFEAGIKPMLFGRPGTYRLTFWHSAGSVARFDGSGNDSSDDGVGLSCDQQITDKLSVAARYGYSDPRVRQINHYFSVGATYSGPIPGRKLDLLGAEVAVVLLSPTYRAVSGVAPTATQFDIYYQIHVLPWLTITPDAQVILNPNQDRAKSSLLVAGVLAEMRF